MTALTQPCCTPAAVLAGKPSEASLQVLETLGLVPRGTIEHVVEAVTFLAMVAATHPQWVSVRCTAAAIFKVVVTCHSGVNGMATHP